MAENNGRKWSYLNSRFDAVCGTFLDAGSLCEVHAETGDGNYNRVPKVP